MSGTRHTLPAVAAAHPPASPNDSFPGERRAPAAAVDHDAGTGSVLPILLLPGWAHPAEALQPLADILGRGRPVRVSGDIPVMEERCILAGWSLGGLRAIAAASRQPDRVAALVLVSSTARMTAAPGFPAGVPARQLQSMRIALRRDAERMLREFFIQAAYPETPGLTRLDERIRAAVALGPDRLAAGLDVLLHTDLREAYVSLPSPCLILHGGQDRIIPAAAADWMLHNHPGAREHRWPEAGHSLPLQQAAAVAGVIEQFLAGLG